MAGTKPAVLPAVYAKFITALAGNALAYLTAYGAVWHLQPALVMLGGALAVLGVPNATPPAGAPVAVAQPSNVTLTDRPTGGTPS